ncbi:hypothetical protein AA23498_2717 [Acetobacter nitrogenifigens DSM 23921 = NBRC 105050]|uniref:Uncharacterized protein n=1 Tax=Acetobacter nitrogenifigens DSM 23921 = NBRC 105050 TaxID=1120919 RepID=A0A511XF29_9PROT|nr:hypothetical protein [Acetobacter nitrogenifigens]GBQ96729.1 hypothetical protein AA23498_2717 [Acetobacter nitrogenifigens DSM 23921 = NBRC 105050]GEN61501.1 hypothetical protein ANI02nite_33850 [Acetobacter nitrogenifigens DSM 23921 = NBRC 105050]
MTKLAALKQKLMENPDVRREYEQADADCARIEGMIRPQPPAPPGDAVRQARSRAWSSWACYAGKP